MKSFGKIILGMAIAACISAIPASAQIYQGLDFKTSFPFNVGNAKMPAGSYRITQTDSDTNVLLIENTDGTHAALIEFIPTHADQPHAQSDVTFQKYGDVDYLNRLWIAGQNYGMKVEPTKVEERLAAKTGAVEHTLTASM
jgi:hypothetical protein